MKYIPYIYAMVLYFNRVQISKILSPFYLCIVSSKKKGRKEMAFSGTIQKCKACDKTVHFVEMVSADGIPYHKTCFKCTHCNGKLVFLDNHDIKMSNWMSSYFQLDGSLYCKPHFDQKFKEMGGISRIPFCHKTVYPLEKVTVEGDFYHKQCFKCAQGGCKLTPSNYAALDGNLFCRPHFSQLFKEKGNYAHLKKAASMKKNESTEKLADQVTSEEGAPEASE
ncbi:Zinc finger, LIM-type [Cynara cardunculus var. scolymus]|uniref:Zinc finger, LIM-type n=1 Tax=Cynara cardunculus var. scolymus TaxID=59895 RepID=A0A103XR97_CYNCS|nr:Zinc finger, LIM-type [Cynara cardunculus var. scolymus]